MIDVSVSDLATIVKCINSLIDEYEEIKINLFNQLKNVCNNWKDGNSVDFDNYIYSDKKESDLLFIYLEDKYNIINYLYSEYSKIGNKIKINLNERNTMLYSIDNCCKQCKKVISSFERIDRSFYYSECNNILRHRDNFIGINNKLTEYKKDLLKLYNKIEKIEKEVKLMLNKLEQVNIKKFEFVLMANRTKGTKAYLDMDLLKQDISKINFYVDEERMCLNKINFNYNEYSKCYYTGNSKTLLNIVNLFNVDIGKIYTKRKEYERIFNLVIKNYESTVEYVNSRFNGEV